MYLQTMSTAFDTKRIDDVRIGVFEGTKPARSLITAKNNENLRGASLTGKIGDSLVFVRISLENDDH